MRLIRDMPGLAVTWAVMSAHGDRIAEARTSAEAMLARVADREILIGSFRDGFFPYDGASIKY